MSKPLPLDLSDLIPQPTTLKLSSHPTHEFKLGAFTLLVEMWAKKRFGEAPLQGITSGDFTMLVPICFRVLDAESKALVKDEEGLAEAVVTFTDRKALSMAVLETVGLSVPVIEAIEKKLAAQSDPQPEPTGQKSTTKSRTPTAAALKRS